MPTCFPSRPSWVRIPSTGDSDDPLEAEAGRWCLVCTHSCFRWFPPFLYVSRPGSRLSSLARKPTAGVGRRSRRESSLVMEGTSTCCFGRWETSPLLPGVQAERLRKPTIEPTCRLFPPPSQVLPVVVPPCTATLDVCRWDQQRTTDSPCAVSAGAETAQGRCKGRRQNSAQPMCQGELLEEERISAPKVVARELAASGGVSHSYGGPSSCSCHSSDTRDGTTGADRAS